jgi:hypothetical protein
VSACGTRLSTKQLEKLFTKQDQTHDLLANDILLKLSKRKKRRAERGFFGE